MQRFALWLCDVNVSAADVTLASLRTIMPTDIEGEWLWTLIAGKYGTKQFLDCAKTVAKLPTNEKLNLAQWVQEVANFAQLFNDLPTVALLPTPRPNSWSARSAPWGAFKALMIAFYEEGLRKKGLPYQSNGTPTNDATRRVTYEQFTRNFRQEHRLDPHPDAREVCVLCGGELKQPAVDHWVSKGAFPLLAVCADNLLPICSECNGVTHKGQKDVHTNGSFVDWFHPYLRHTNGALCLHYDEATFAIRVESTVPEDSLRVRNLDDLLNLRKRWSREFKAEYHRLQREIQQTRQRRDDFTIDQLESRLIDYRDGLSASEPNHEVHSVVAEVLLDPARLHALFSC